MLDQNPETNQRILVEVVDLDARDGQQIGVDRRATELLKARSADVRGAISEAVRIAGSALADQEPARGWKVASLQAVFGLTLAAEAGIVVGKASAEAVFEITVTLERE